VIKVLVMLMLAVVIASLFSGLYFLLRDRGGMRTVRALTVRIAISLLLFAVLMISMQVGVRGWS
jgi:hypothetical protein